MAKNRKPPLIAAAAGVAVRVRNDSPGRIIASKIQTAMSQALLIAMAEGVNDPAEQRKRMSAARYRVRGRG